MTQTERRLLAFLKGKGLRRTSTFDQISEALDINPGDIPANAELNRSIGSLVRRGYILAASDHAEARGNWNKRTRRKQRFITTWRITPRGIAASEE